jgi:hypothetical protein
MLGQVMISGPPAQPPAPRVLRISGTAPARGGRPSDRTAEIGLRFGLPLDGARRVLFRDVLIPLTPGTVVLLVGPSGCGKTSALAEIERALHGACVVGRMAFPADTAIIDRIAPGRPLAEAVRYLTACGLSQPSLWLRTFDQLSEGERFRARLARAAAMLGDAGAGAVLLCDEFCDGVHQRLARAIAFAFGKLVQRSGLCAVAACTHEQLAGDLHARIVIRLSGDGGHEISTFPPNGSRIFSLRRRLRIEPGGKGDYQRFAAMHYRSADELGFVDKVFVLRDGPGGEPLGIVVYSYPPLELALRNQATQKRFCRDPAALNRSMRIVRRLVIHPDVRGCGLGHYLLRQTMPRVGTEFVECLASMGEFNPVCEKAGMQRIGQCALPPERQAALAALCSLDGGPLRGGCLAADPAERQTGSAGGGPLRGDCLAADPAERQTGSAGGVDPLSWDFVDKVGSNPRVRAIVAKVVYEWYAATTGGGRERVERQSAEFLARAFRGLIASRPTYYLWRRGQKPCKSIEDDEVVASRRDPTACRRHPEARGVKSRGDSDGRHAAHEGRRYSIGGQATSGTRRPIKPPRDRHHPV